MERRPDGDDEQRTIDGVEPAAAPTDTDADTELGLDVPPDHAASFDEPDGELDGGDELDGVDEGIGEDGPRRRRGSLGTVIAAGMLGLEQALGKKPKQEAPIVIASNSDPEDIDEHGIVIDLDAERTVVSPPLPGRHAAKPLRKRVKRRRDA